MFTTDPLKLITSSRSGNHALNIVCLFLFERQIGYRGAVSHCHGCREHAALLSLLNLLVAALRCAFLGVDSIIHSRLKNARPAGSVISWVNYAHHHGTGCLFGFNRAIYAPTPCQLCVVPAG